MTGTVTLRGRTYKTVTVYNVPAGTSDERIAEVAMGAAGEAPAQLFGWRVIPQPENPGTYSVALYTD